MKLEEVSRYGLHHREIAYMFLADAAETFLHGVQTDSAAQQSCYCKGAKRSFPENYAAGE
jgi:hypothetical protein